jgi:hypothetical protein
MKKRMINKEKTKMDNKNLLNLLGQANSLLRSAYAIASRNGVDTNWEAFKNQVEMALDSEHEVLQGYWLEQSENVLKLLEEETDFHN